MTDAAKVTQALTTQVLAAQQALQAGNWQTAEQLGQQILQTFPQQPEALELLGLLYCQTTQFERAIAYYQQFLALQPDIATAHYNLGTAFSKLAQTEAAITHFQHTIALDPNFYPGHYNLGNAYQAQQREAEAIACYRQVLALQPQHRQALNNLGICLKQQGQLEAAVAAFEQALALQPDHALTHNNLGDTLRQLKQFDAAVHHLQQAVALDPSSPEAYRNLGLALSCQDQLDAATVAYQQALTLNPDHALVLDSLGSIMRQRGKLAEAMTHLQRAIDLNPKLPEPHYDLGLVCYEQGNFAAAAELYQRSLQLRPDFAPAQFSNSVLQLLRGDFEVGWRGYESRWEGNDIALPTFPQPQWTGADLVGKTILLHAEQGFGDTIQFVRYAPMLAAAGATVIVGCPNALKRLLETVPGVDRVISDGSPQPPFDYHIPLLSLPYRCHTQLETIPAVVPYLQQNLLPACPLTFPSPAIGIVWAGNPKNGTDRDRSTHLIDFLPLLQLPITWVSLQKGKAEELQQFQADFPQLNLQDLAEQLPDFADTAAAIAQLDLVITVDTAVAHLAGALGKPVWILLAQVADWRWLLDREDSPWYPTARLFRQQQRGNWGEVFSRVEVALQSWLSQQSPLPPKCAGNILQSPPELGDLGGLNCGNRANIPQSPPELDSSGHTGKGGPRGSSHPAKTSSKPAKPADLTQDPALPSHQPTQELSFLDPQNPIGIGIGFPVGGSLGWGVYGLNLALQLSQIPGVVPVPLLSVDVAALNPIARSRLATSGSAAQQLQQLLQQHPDQELQVDLWVLKALGNHLAMGEACRRIQGKRNIGVIFSEDTDFTPVEIAQARQFDKIIAGSHWNAEILSQHGLTNVVTVQQGIDPTLFHPAPKSGLLSDRFVIFSGGKLEYRKGQDIAIAAFRIFRQRHPEALLVTAWHNHWIHTLQGIDQAGHVISTPKVNASGELNITAWLAENGIPANAVLDVGLVPHAMSAAILREADVALFTNRAEGGTNLVAMESLACGIPTILSMNTGHLDLIGEVQSADQPHCYPLRSQSKVAAHPHYRGTEGWGESSVEEVVAVLEAVYADRQTAIQRGLRAADWMQDWSWERQTKRLLAVLM
jgi:tetratricopeptide (TPR) repeat protein/glycosyltransferase involved in cell wall biosynthesis